MSAVRRIAYLSGTRADFGLMCETLRRIHADPALALSVVATGTLRTPRARSAASVAQEPVAA